MTSPTEPTNRPTVQLGPDTFINRELGWIEFNRRVLALAQDPDVPLLERLRFLSIFSNNLDEFYMVRVASYHNKLRSSITRTRPDGIKPNDLINRIRDLVTDMVNQQRDTQREVLSLLEKEGVVILAMDKLTREQREAARMYFQREVFPVLTPLAVDHARPFPFISNLSLSLAVWLRREDDTAHDEFVRLKVPEDALTRMINLREVIMRRYADSPLSDDDRIIFIYLDDLIADNLDMLFPGMTVLEHTPFRVTRNADIDYEQEDEDEPEDISALIEASVRERRFGPVVRLSVPQGIGERTLERLIEELEVNPERDVYFVDGSLGAASLADIVDVDRDDLKHPRYAPRVPEPLNQGGNIFDAIRQRDHIVHHPYDSFGPVEDFFKTAARDPNVLAIKATLYRVGKNSPVVRALMDARDNDKQVAALVELKARFDEANNLEWARAMEHKGVHVTYGVEELPVKTHAKIALVVRREGDTVRRYVHLGTGNYNAGTARIYEDIGLMTSNDEIADDASRLFNRLTGFAPATTYSRLLVAPDFLRPKLLDLLDGEIAAVESGKASHVILKMNQLEEDAIIAKLYEASMAGVKVSMIIRGFCCLRPGVEGLSENIRVISILGRFLEHSRAYYFPNAAEGERLYCGSADLMRRNLLNRVEVVYPVLDPQLRARIVRMLETELADNQGAWEMQPDGTFIPVEPAPGEAPLEAQKVFMEKSFGG